MKVLLAIDGSECSKHALDFVATRPWKSEDQFLVAHVVEPIPVDIGIAYVPSAYSQTDGANAEAAKELVKVASEQLQASLKDHKVESKVIFGLVKSELVELAKSWQADLIVMGSHGRKGINKFLLGSVAEEILKVAPCSVEIVKQSEVK